MSSRSIGGRSPAACLPMANAEPERARGDFSAVEKPVGRVFYQFG
ncbi:MAG: hypothetical protein ABIF82_10530 [Planctomycetota bacterium]